MFITNALFVHVRKQTKDVVKRARRLLQAALIKEEESEDTNTVAIAKLERLREDA